LDKAWQPVEKLLELEKYAAFGGSAAAGASQRAGVSSANCVGEAFCDSRLMIADILAGFERAGKKIGGKRFGRCSGRADDRLDIPLGEERLSALSHSASDYHGRAALGQPGRQQAGLMGWCFDILADDQRFPVGVDIEKGEAGAMAEMDGEFAVGEGNGEAHGQTP